MTTRQLSGPVNHHVASVSSAFVADINGEGIYVLTEPTGALYWSVIGFIIDHLILPVDAQESSSRQTLQIAENMLAQVLPRIKLYQEDRRGVIKRPLMPGCVVSKGDSLIFAYEWANGKSTKIAVGLLDVHS